MLQTWIRRFIRGTSLGLVVMLAGCASVSLHVPESGHTARLSVHADESQRRGTVLVLNGCDGPGGPHYQGWVSRIRSLGYNVVAVDSFSSRGYSVLCASDKVLSYSSDAARDARAVGRWVKQQPWSNGKVAAIGFSLGGGQTLYLNTTLRPDTELIFAGVIAYYPNCDLISETSRVLAPMQVHIGALDEWTFAKTCQDLARSKNFQEMELFVYEGAHHAFDGPWNGVARCLRGPHCTVARNEAADRLAMQRVAQFLARVLR